MKILKVIANGFKNCADDFSISFVPSARKTAEDKEYELEEIADGLFVFSTIGIVGKNASGKTTALDLLSICYEMLEKYRIGKKNYSLDGVSLTLFFYHDGYIYKYTTKLKENSLDDRALILFSNQEVLRKRYYKSNANEVFESDGSESLSIDGELPEDTSILFFVLRKLSLSGVYIESMDMGIGAYKAAFSIKNTFNLSDDIFQKIIQIFDENITELKMVDDHNYRLVFCGKEEVLSDRELFYRISSGTTKGIALYTFVALSLINGFDLVVDEIENHFHKSLVENIISLYKDKSINKKNATLIFATHYCELLDIFDRRDNIYIAKSEEKVSLYNMYRDYDVRSELLKSKQFYNNVFKTAVNYEALMDLKGELKKYEAAGNV